MRKSIIAKDSENEFRHGSRNWLLHARYVRGEHALCLELADDLQKKSDNTHRYAHFIKGLVYSDAGRHQDALERFHSCIRLQPQDPEPLKQVAKSLNVLRKIQGPVKRDDGTWRIRKNIETQELVAEPNIIGVTKSHRLRWLGHLLRMGEDRAAKERTWDDRLVAARLGDLGIAWRTVSRRICDVSKSTTGKRLRTIGTDGMFSFRRPRPSLGS
ncbi:hypothetical protein MSG28_008880 [Choristoneura fumiferana]|uniref:Uncharacterized protein n=1 Tax=Choristoneura fumiferana TaxID=7141 RepID=A0ACC0J8C5_CHOFU|nr:hypothetical protein MSG28_008880 [Choristoneura fumiferana]